MASSVGASLRGDHLLERDARASRPRPAALALLPDARSMRGFPARAVEVFEELLAEPAGDLSRLRQEALDYVRIFEAAAAQEPLLDAGEARALAERAAALLDGLGPSPAPAHRQLVWAAVRYFTKQDDAESDLIVGGLDDDREVMEAVEAYLSEHAR